VKLPWRHRQVMTSAPGATAIGFGLGTLLAERLMRCRETTISQALLWPFRLLRPGAAAVAGRDVSQKLLDVGLPRPAFPLDGTPAQHAGAASVG
jgi:hypothetical protein